MALADFFSMLLEQDAVDVKGTSARMPGAWLRHLRQCLARFFSDGDKRQEEGRLSPTGCQRAKRKDGRSQPRIRACNRRFMIMLAR